MVLKPKEYPVFDLNPNIIGPKSPKQYDFMHSDANITVFGGAAGAGKSYLGVMDFLKHVHDPNFRGVLVRRTTPQLTGPGGLLEKAMALFALIDPKVKWRAKQDHFAFSSGAKVFLRHFQDLKAKDNFQGWEVSKFLIDEGQQFEEAMVVYLLSRMRNPACSVKPHMKITCNPDYDSFLRHWLDWWLDPETGIPLPERDGVTRWFVRLNDKMHWGASFEEVYEKYHTPGLPMDHHDQCQPLSFCFISGNVYDNPVLCKADPGYVAMLKGLGRVEKARLLHGSWLAREEGSGYFKEEWVHKIPMPPLHAGKRVRAWDISGTMPSDTNPEPDWTAGVLMSKDRNGMYTIEHVVRDRRRHGGVFDLILETAKQDGDDVTIIIPQDPGAAGKAYAAQLIRDLADYGFYARMKATNKSKVTRFAPFAAVAEAGGVQMVLGEWNNDYISELVRFDGSRNIKDDMVDATSDAFNNLSTDIHLPDFTVPVMTQTNPFRLY
ncbi:putative terminase large subunit [Pseudomonas phage UAVern]|uniref:Terminase large subunit n=1 Tax=Pseudomonas phage UAVern TaxID=2856997 RepID=A0A975UWS7_9CAUD|nr:putative terminase large subunit [Pseudomonas phage UAVern]